MSKSDMKSYAQRAKEASYVLSTLSNAKRNRVLTQMAASLVTDTKSILSANKKDLQKARANGLSSAMIGRLTLNDVKIKGMAKGLKEIAALSDPLDILLEKRKRPNGLVIEKRSVPLGVILIIFESRPNVTADCAGLCIKSGNAVILRGGKEAFNSNRAIHASLVKVLKRNKLPVGCVEFIQSTDRSDVNKLVAQAGLIDVVIPRGGEGLIRKVTELSKVPVLKHYKGICHTYIDGAADLTQALSIALNAKVQNPGVCNAMETLLVDKKIAKAFLPKFANQAYAYGLEIRGCDATRKILPQVKKATKKDWQTEYLEMILSVRVVNGVTGAIEHIREYGSNHSEAVISRNETVRKKFIAEVDAACVFENASTRFSDGGEFGMGAEMGISTDKLHARGPVGIRELTSYKYVIRGKGQVRG